MEGNEESKLPLGATDLSPDHRFEKFKEKRIPQEEFASSESPWKPMKELAWPEETKEKLNQYQTEYSIEIIELMLENQEMKREISDLQKRVSKVEELLKQRSQPVGSFND